MIRALLSSKFKNPKHFFSNNLIPINEYDSLYENFNNTNHFRWKEFSKNYNIKFGQKILLKDRLVTDRWCGFLFFKDRNEKSKLYVQAGDYRHEIVYNSLLTTNTNCKIILRNNVQQENYALQLYYSKSFLEQIK